MGIGPVFGDFVTNERVKGRRRHFRGGSGLFYFIPHILLLIVVVFLFVRLFNLQVVHGEYYRRLSDDNRTRTIIEYAPRGIIYDRDGQALVSNTPAFKVVDPSASSHSASSGQAGQGEKESGKDVVRWVGREEALALEAKGATVAADVQRTYLHDELFAHVLGYVGQISETELFLPEYGEYGNLDFVGKEGIEREYEHLLHGVNGKRLYEVDSSGATVRLLGEQDPIPGKNIKTTLDLDIQKAAARAMKDISRGAVIVSDVRSGGILALYSKPTFDPNLFTHNSEYEAKGEYTSLEELLGNNDKKPLLHRAIAGVYPPGSTYKLVTATAALESGKVDKNFEVEDTGIHRVGEFSFGNWFFLEQGKTDGIVDVVKAIARSNDIYFYIVAEKTGISQIAEWSKKFGLGKRSGIDLPGEAKGMVPGPSWKERTIGEQWYTGDTYNMGIGQGYLLTTPLQVNTWASVFASGGKLMRPHLLLGQEEIVRRDFVARENLDLVREGMRRSCEVGGVAYPFFNFTVKNKNLRADGLDYLEASGSARTASDSANVRVVVGCKTGTSETPGEDTDPHAWITVFAPFYNPEVVVTVLAENAGQGSEVAGPVAKEILTEYFENK